LKFSWFFLSIFAGACATSSNIPADFQNVQYLIDRAGELAPSCIIQIDEPTVCNITNCQWSDGFKQCFGGESPIHDVDLQRRSFDKAACAAFDEALQPALAPLKSCGSVTELSSNPKLKEYCGNYMESLMSSCAGYTGYVLAISDAQHSAEYRKELASEASRPEILEHIESRLVRYRPER